MDWLNIHSSTLDSEEFVGADMIERGTWLCLQRFCIGQENGGVIKGGRLWKDRQWQQLVRVTKREVLRPARLWEWDGDNLVLFFYPVAKENEVREKRDTARTNGRLGGRPKKNPKETDVGSLSEPEPVVFEKAERKGKERNNTPLPPDGGESGVGDAALVEKIKSLRKRWGTGAALDAKDARVFAKNREGWAAYAAGDWPLVAEFLRAGLAPGTAYFQPEKLGKALEMPAALLADARDWKGKQRPPKAPRLVVVPETADVLSEAEVAEMLAPFKTKRG